MNLEGTHGVKPACRRLLNISMIGKVFISQYGQRGEYGLHPQRRPVQFHVINVTVTVVSSNRLFIYFIIFCLPAISYKRKIPFT